MFSSSGTNFSACIWLHILVAFGRRIESTDTAYGFEQCVIIRMLSYISRYIDGSHVPFTFSQMAISQTCRQPPQHVSVHIVIFNDLSTVKLIP
jgi:hypothetical protein